MRGEYCGWTLDVFDMTLVSSLGDFSLLMLNILCLLNIYMELEEEPRHRARVLWTHLTL